MKHLNVTKKEKYKKTISMYGIYPLLKLLKEYEDIQNFRECKIIFDGLTEYIEDIQIKNKIIAENLKIPTHLNQIDKKMRTEMNLDTSEKVKNADLYIKEIKKLVNGL